MAPPLLSVAFLLLPNFTLTAFSAFIDVLRLAADEGDRSSQNRCRWTVLGDGLAPVKSSCGVAVTPWADLDEADHFEYLVIVGGLLDPKPAIPQRVTRFMQTAARRGAALAGLCTGVFALLEAGLMARHKCCVSWFHRDDLIAAFPNVAPISDQIFVVDGKRLTCSGGMASADMAAWLVRKHLKGNFASKSLHIMLIDRARAPTSSQPHPALIKNISDNQVRRAVILMQQDMADPIHIESVAKALGLSRRQLERLFRKHLNMSPHTVAQELRLQNSLHAVLLDHFPMAQIALDHGFSDQAHFSRIFRARYGKSPSAMRKNPHKTDFEQLKKSLNV